MRSIIWENKGVILGICLYILDNYNKLKNSLIIVENDRYKFILKRLFPKIKFKLKDNNKNNNKLMINIKNQKKKGLIINNINNINIINGKNVSLLPWYDRHNPIIIYVYDKNKYKDKEKILKSINKFSKYKRLEPYGHPNFIENICKLRIWDTYFEYYVLKQLNLKFGYDPFKTYNFISDVITEKPCQVGNFMIQYPLIYEKKVVEPVYIPVIFSLIKEVKKEIVKIKDQPNKCEEYEKLIKLLNSKLESLNSMLNLK